MTDIAPTVSACLNLPPPAQASGAVIGEIAEDLAGCGRVAVLAPDALGVFPWRRWRKEMPFLWSLHAEHSVVLRSIPPSVTPVNFSAMVTGAEMPVHGVRSKTDAIACETLFDVVRRAGGKSAGVGQEGHTGCELLARHACIRGNVPAGSDARVADKIIQIVDDGAPQFLIAQLYEVDWCFHKFGPSSPSVVPILRETDGRLERLTRHLKPAGYGVIILSDHGQHDVPDAPDGQNKGDHGTDAPEDCLVPCTWV